jgi:hypothetical protein
MWSWAPDGSPTPRQTGRLTVGRKLTSTSTHGDPMPGALTGLLCSWGKFIRQLGPPDSGNFKYFF